MIIILTIQSYSYIVFIITIIPFTHSEEWKQCQADADKFFAKGLAKSTLESYQSGIRRYKSLPQSPLISDSGRHSISICLVTICLVLVIMLICANYHHSVVVVIHTCTGFCKKFVVRIKCDREMECAWSTSSLNLL